MVGVALLFNPVIPVGLTRDIWVILNFLEAVVLGFAILRLR